MRGFFFYYRRVDKSPGINFDEVLYKTLLWSSAVFTLAHAYIIPYNPLGLIPIFGVSVLFGYLYIVRGYGIIAFVPAFHDVFGFLGMIK